MYFDRNSMEGLGVRLPPIRVARLPFRMVHRFQGLGATLPFVSPTIPMVKRLNLKFPRKKGKFCPKCIKAPCPCYDFGPVHMPTPTPFTPIPEKVPVKSPELDAGNFFQESLQVRRIILQYRKLKDLRSKAPVSPNLLSRHGEFVKYLQAYLELYRNRLPADTLKEIESVVNDTSLAGQMSGLGFFPLLIFGLTLVGGTVITKMVTDTVKANIDKQEQEIELNTKLVEQGKSPLRKEAGFFEQFSDMAKVGLLIGGGFLLLNVFKRGRSKK